MSVDGLEYLTTEDSFKDGTTFGGCVRVIRAYAPRYGYCIVPSLTAIVGALRQYSYSRKNVSTIGNLISEAQRLHIIMGSDRELESGYEMVLGLDVYIPPFVSI